MSPKITGLKTQKRNPKRVNVYIDGEFAFGLSRFTAAWLSVGQELEEEKINNLLEQDAGEVAYQRALNYLSYRPRTEQEVRRNLQKKDISEEIIEQTLERLRKNSLVNDLDFVKFWVEDRVTFRPRGKRAMRYELIKKGIDRKVIDQAFSEITINEEKMALQLARKQAGKYASDTEFDFRRKMSAYLGRRGFSYEDIRSVIEIILKETQLDNSGTDRTYRP